MAVQSALTNVLVSWTAPASGGASRTGYRIFYQTGGGSEQSVDVGAGATSHTLTRLQSGATYSILIVAVSGPFHSTETSPLIVTFACEFLVLCVADECANLKSVSFFFSFCRSCCVDSCAKPHLHQSHLHSAQW